MSKYFIQYCITSKDNARNPNFNPPFGTQSTIVFEESSDALAIARVARGWKEKMQDAELGTTEFPRVCKFIRLGRFEELQWSPEPENTL